MRKGPPFGSPSSALPFIFFLQSPQWVSSFSSWTAGRHVDHAGSRRQRSRLNLDCHWRTFAAQEDMSVLSPNATVKADSCNKVMSASPLKADTVQNEMSAKGQQRTFDVLSRQFKFLGHVGYQQRAKFGHFINPAWNEPGVGKYAGRNRQ